MSQKSSAPAARASASAKAPAEQVVRDIRRATRKQYLAEEKIRIVMEGLRGEDSIAALCRREGIAESLYNPALFTKAGENWRQFPDFPLLATEELDYLPRHMRHPLGETPPAQPIGWLF
jgi:transposase